MIEVYSLYRFQNDLLRHFKPDQFLYNFVTMRYSFQAWCGKFGSVEATTDKIKSILNDHRLTAKTIVVGIHDNHIYAEIEF